MIGSWRALVRRTPRVVADALEARSPALAARIDWNITSLWPWSGPMNGQTGRQAIVREILEAFRPTVIVETGTHRGASAAFLFDVAGVPVVTSEISERSYWFARRRFLNHAGIDVRRSDSREMLRSLVTSGQFDLTRPFLYLDAHWHDDVPLAGELSIISESFTGGVVMIDDFEVPGDAGYGFDDYGSGRELTLRNYEQHFPPTHMPLFPSLPSADERPPQRGCVVLAPRDWVAGMAGRLTTLTAGRGGEGAASRPSSTEHDER